jgi:hypothetical protein
LLGGRLLGVVPERGDVRFQLLRRRLQLRVRRDVHDQLLRRQLHVQRHGVPARLMGIVGERPTSGMRLRLVLDRSRKAYEGTATTPVAQWPVRAELDAAGEVKLDTTAPAEVAEYTRRVVRIAARNAKTDGTPVPRVIQRWRADR